MRVTVIEFEIYRLSIDRFGAHVLLRLLMYVSLLDKVRHMRYKNSASA